MNNFVPEFEKPIVEIERRIAELREYSSSKDLAFSREIERLEAKARQLRQEVYSSLTRWQRVQLARHPNRPYTLDYIRLMMTDFIELHGDRLFADDPAIVAGIGTLGTIRITLIGHQKARETREKIRRNFGMPQPEGYRKSIRLMKMALVFTAGGLPDRYSRRLPWAGCRRTRPGGSDRAQSLRDGPPASPDRGGHHRGRSQRRSPGYRSGGPDSHAREQLVFGHLAGRMRCHSLPRQRQRPHRCRIDEGGTGRPPQTGHHRPQSSGKPERGDTITPGPPASSRRTLLGELEELAASARGTGAGAAIEKFARMGVWNE